MFVKTERPKQQLITEGREGEGEGGEERGRGRGRGRGGIEYIIDSLFNGTYKPVFVTRIQ